MPLITCPDCQNQVSQHAQACPGCGRPMQALAYRPAPRLADRVAGEKQNVNIAYGLWAASYLLGVVGIAGLILCYVKRPDVRGTYLAAHYDWIIETFWLTVGGVVAGILLVAMMMAVSEGFGVVALVAMMLFGIGWPAYRLIKGWVALNDGRAPESFASPW
jgi:uncharacterized membrane protein